MTKLRPILFSSSMVLAILAGTKTQTRRILKPQPSPDPARIDFYGERLGWKPESNSGKVNIFEPHTYKCPYGQIGDILWVREAWSIEKLMNHQEPELNFKYEADGRYKVIPFDKIEWAQQKKWDRNYPSIHMPYEAARIFLEITDIRVERLQDISVEDAIAEGIGVETIQNQVFYTDYLNEGFARPDPRMSYASLWESINSLDSWNANPFVWVIEFEQIEKP